MSITQNVEIIDSLLLPSDISECIECIPNLLHIIWVGDDPMPAYAIDNYNKWKELMPDWIVRLWTNDDINDTEFPPGILDKIRASTKGAQKADIMRYTIIEKYGGFYADTDVVPYRSLESLRHLKYDTILCHDNTMTWEYCSIGFFGAIPHAPLFQKACELSSTAIINTPDIHLKTGPHLFGKAVCQTSPSHKYGLLIPYYFYSNTHSSWDGIRFGTHIYKNTWGWGG